MKKDKDTAIAEEKELIATFKEEATASLANATQLLLDENLGIEGIPAIYRVVHSISGAALFLGLKELRNFVAPVMGLLDKMRSGTIELTEDKKELLHECFAHLRTRLLGDSGSDETLEETEQNLLERLKKINKKSKEPDDRKSEGTDIAVSQPGQEKYEVKGRILVVDDLLAVRKKTKAFLEKHGHTVETAESGVIALEEIVRSEFDLILLDIEMPEMNGFEVCHRLRCEERTGLLPLIAFYTQSEKAETERFRLGANDFINKEEFQSNPARFLMRVSSLVKTAKLTRDAIARTQKTSQKKEKELEASKDQISSEALLKKKIKILVAGDGEDIRTAFEKQLKLANYEVVTAGSGEEAIKRFKNESFDLVFIDLKMPEMDGFEVIRQIRAIESESQSFTPTIIVTDRADFSSIEEGIVDADEYLLKPFKETAFRTKIHSMLQLKEAMRKQIVLKEQVNKKTEELREKNLQLMEMDRIAGIATLAAGIAHEINNPLSFVKSSLHFVKKSMGKMAKVSKYWDDKPVPESLREEYEEHLKQINFTHAINSLDKRFESIKNGLERVIEIVKNLKSFSRVDLAEIASININKSIEETIKILKTEELENVEFAIELQDLPQVLCEVISINQCLFTVLQNAIEAVENNGVIKINTAYNEEENQIIIEIIDNGKGMSSEVLRRVFNPFFTTKPVGSGMGLGLSMIERVINRHDGRINLKSKEGFGTTVTIELPVRDLRQSRRIER